MEQANDIQETLGRSYGLPDDIDEDDLEAGMENGSFRLAKAYLTKVIELDALGDELLFEEEETPSYLQEPTYVSEPSGTATEQEPSMPVSIDVCGTNITLVQIFILCIICRVRYRSMNLVCYRSLIL